MKTKTKKNLLTTATFAFAAYKVFAEILKAENPSPEVVASLLALALAIILLTK